MPWIDPKKEAEGLALMEDNVYMSAPEIIRRRGANPRDVLDQESAWQVKLREWGLSRTSARPSTPATLPNENAVPAGDQNDDA
jgi:capsid protein